MCCLLKYVIGFLHLFFFQTYSMAVYLVKQLSSTVLLQRLRAKGIRNPDHSRALIKEKLTADPDSEIATTSLRVSLLCPVSVCLRLPLKMVYTLILCTEHENSAYF